VKLVDVVAEEIRDRRRAFSNAPDHVGREMAVAEVREDEIEPAPALGGGGGGEQGFPEASARFVGGGGVRIEIEERLHTVREEGDLVSERDEWVVQIALPEIGIEGGVRTARDGEEDPHGRGYLIPSAIVTG
jgi:hypothetical protein